VPEEASNYAIIYLIFLASIFEASRQGQQKGQQFYSRLISFQAEAG
jgi:hypothetical protein